MKIKVITLVTGDGSVCDYRVAYHKIGDVTGCFFCIKPKEQKTARNSLVSV